MRLPRLVFVCLVVLASAARAEDKAPAPGAKPESLKDRSSYAFGVNLVGVAKQNGIELDGDYFIRGVRDALGDKLVMTPDEIRATIQEQEQARTAPPKANAPAAGVGGEKPPDSGAKPESLKDRSSYAFGVNLVAVVKRNGIELD